MKAPVQNPSYVVMLHVRCDCPDTALALAIELGMAVGVAADCAIDSINSPVAEIEIGQLTMAQSDRFKGFEDE